jgi:class 3 adenylate cyclase/PAS domain-containing protein
MWLSDLTSRPAPDLTMFQHPGLINPILNAPAVGSAIDTCLAALRDYMSDVTDQVNTLVNIIRYSIIGFVTVAWIGLLVLQNWWLWQNKVEVYKCLTALPKNVCSELSEMLRVLKNNEDDQSEVDEQETEVTKQEENLLKIFATAGDSHSGSRSSLVISFLSVIMLGFALGVIAELCQVFPPLVDAFSANAPHLDGVLGTPTYMFEALLKFNDASTAELNAYDGMFSNGYGLGNKSYVTLVTEIVPQIQSYVKFYHSSLFGDYNAGLPPFNGYSRQLDLARESIKCTDSNAAIEDISEIIACFSLNIQIMLIEPLIWLWTQPIVDEAGGIKIGMTGFIRGHPYSEELWLLARDMYDTVFAPLFESIVDALLAAMAAAIPEARTTVITFVIIAVLVCFLIQLSAAVENRQLKFVLRLLLHANPTIVAGTPKIMDVLGGDFSNRHKDKSHRNNVFFEDILQNLPDAVIITNAQYVIVSLNAAFERIYQHELISGDIREFFKQPQFVGNFAPLWDSKTHCVLIKLRTPSLTSHLEINVTAVAQNFVFTTRDKTQTVCYNELIEEERANSDKMLASILPPSLVPRVQAGEVNISFSVQSASVLFMDIVEFTPWCASNSASVVMSSLNVLYREFDAVCASKATLTKIKCIGDCYMAAAGIFSEVNQPAVHAKEMVEFGLESIKALGRVNREINQTLRMRVGINTGGPLVAGVIGTEKPTFEIIGPAINMAQQMEHEGVPMNVHISRSTYELIYAGNFIVRERGQITIKQGQVVTYLVEGENVQAA